MIKKTKKPSDLGLSQFFRGIRCKTDLSKQNGSEGTRKFEKSRTGTKKVSPDWFLDILRVKFRLTPSRHFIVVSHCKSSPPLPSLAPPKQPPANYRLLSSGILQATSEYASTEKTKTQRLYFCTPQRKMTKFIQFCFWRRPLATLRPMWSGMT